jgi:hypothetical protein
MRLEGRVVVYFILSRHVDRSSFPRVAGANPLIISRSHGKSSHRRAKK